ncbi:hypothetical protein FO519_004766 [Halicephalobus sp. NKZ332]|nr:hypothetical protein FO519_004766 [Halicephalobus sp. NKZ332]
MNDLPPDKNVSKIDSDIEEKNRTVLRMSFGVLVFAFCCLSMSTIASLVWLNILTARHDETVESSFMLVATVLQFLSIVFHFFLLKYRNRELCYVTCVITGGIICYLVFFIIFQSVNNVSDNLLFQILPIAVSIGFVHCLLIAADINVFRTIDGNNEKERISNAPFNANASVLSKAVRDTIDMNSLAKKSAGTSGLNHGAVVVIPEKHLTKGSQHVAVRKLKIFSIITGKKMFGTIPKKDRNNTTIGTDTVISDYPNEMNPFEEGNYPETNNPFSDQYSELSSILKSASDLSSVFLSDVASELPGLSSASLAELHTNRELSEPRILTPNATSTPKIGFRSSQRRTEYINPV